MESHYTRLYGLSDDMPFYGWPLITNKCKRVLSQLNTRALSTPRPHMSDRSSRSNTIGVETVSQIHSTRMIQMKIQAYIHGLKSLRYHIHEFWHKIWSVTQSRLTGATSSKMTNLTTVLMCMPRLLQCSSFTRKWLSYSEIWATEVVGPQTLNTTRTATETYQEAYQLEEHQA